MLDCHLRPHMQLKPPFVCIDSKQSDQRDLREWFKYFEKMSENDSVEVDLTKKIC